MPIITVFFAQDCLNAIKLPYPITRI